MKKEMSEVLEERKGVREVKAVLKRLLEVEDAVERVEGLLGLGPGGGEVDRFVLLSFYYLSLSLPTSLDF